MAGGLFLLVYIISFVTRGQAYRKLRLLNSSVTFNRRLRHVTETTKRLFLGLYNPIYIKVQTSLNFLDFYTYCKHHTF